MSDRREDLQEDKVQRAEDSVYKGLKFDDVASAQAFVNKIIKSKWWSSRVPLIREVKIDTIDKSKLEVKKHAFIVYINLPLWAMREMTFISILSKMAIPKQCAWNGREYANFATKMTKRFMGMIHAEDLKNAYKKHSVKFTVRNKKK